MTSRTIVGLCLMCAAALLGGCGGGGSGGGAPTASALANLEAPVRGDEETAVVDPDARGTFVAEVRSDGEVLWALAGEAAWAADVTAIRVYAGAAGADGALLFEIPGVSLDPATRSASGSVRIDAALAAQIAADPASYYAKVVTTTAPAGLARNQLAVLGDVELHAALRGDEETAVTDAAASAGLTVVARGDGDLDFVLAGGPTAAVGAITGAQLRAGSAGADGSVLATLDLAGAAIDILDGTLTNRVPAGVEVLALLRQDPASVHASVAVPAAPGGVARGQMSAGPATWNARLDEVAGSGARGGVTLAATSFDTGRVDIAVPSAQDIDDVTGAGLHDGGLAVDGPLVADLMAGADFTTDAATNSASGSVGLDATVVARLLADPDDFYAILRTAAAPGGVARGQGESAPPALLAPLDGTQPVIVVDATARAGLALRAAGADEIEFVFAVPDDVDLGAVDTAALREGAAGLPGLDVVDLDAAPDFDIDESSGLVRGTAPVPPGLLARLLAAPEEFHAILGTPAAPDGLVRGQLDGASVERVASLLGTELGTIVDPDARAGVTVRLGPDGAAEVVVAVPDTIGIENVTDVALRDGSPGVDGPELADLLLAPDLVRDTATDVATGTVRPAPEAAARLLGAAERVHAVLATAAAPAGLVRGQVEEELPGWAAILTGDQPTTVVDPAARGAVTISLDSTSSARFVVAVPAADDVTALTAAHLHVGGAGADGPVALDLLAAADLTQSVATGTAEGTVALDGALAARLLADPRGFYADLHTAAAPDGLVRGQVADGGVTFEAAMTGGEQTVPVDPTAAGFSSLVCLGVDRVAYRIEMANPPPGDVVLAQIHDGPAGTDGPVLADLLTDGDFEVAGSSILGTATIDPRTFARILASPNDYYADVHTEATRATGIARGQTDLVPPAVAPSNLRYATSPATYETGTEIEPNTPSNDDGAPTRYFVQPALPQGLALDRDTGVISGTPTVVSDAADYTITASNAGGSTTVVLSITVVLGPPDEIEYPGPADYVVGLVITANVPSVVGGEVTAWAVVPSLPAGLVLDAATGTLSGTPTEASASASYTITGSNAAGSVDVVLTIEVAATLDPPSGLSYTTDLTYDSGCAITPNTATISGGAVATWSVSPALPVGLSLDASGAIRGTPAEVTAAANYTVTASNAAGSTNAVVRLTIALGAPKDCEYEVSTQVGVVGALTFQDMSPTISGGAVATWSVSPALPLGLSIDGDGVISGTPLVAALETVYTVTATNASGSTNTTVTITVLP